MAAIVLLGGAAYLVTRPKIYESTATVALLPVSNNAAVLPNYPNLIASLIPTYVELVSSPVLLSQVAPTLPFRISVSQLASQVYGASLSNAAVINIVGESSDPVRAQEIAAATTIAFLAHVQGNGVVVAQIYGRPTVPGQPASPRKKLLLGVIILLAIVLGLGAGLMWDRLLAGAKDGGPRDSDAWRARELDEVTGRPPVLGIVRGRGPATEGASIHDGSGFISDHDDWRSLRSNFMYAMLGRQMHSVSIMSPLSGPAKTAVSANLAATVAEMGLAVVLVDADVHNSRLHKVFSLDNEEGLTSTIVNGTELSELLRPVPAFAGLNVITAGPPLPAQGDEGTLYRQQLPRLTSLGDLVIVDGPSLRADMGADLVARITDGVILVVHSGALTWKQVDVTIHDLTSSGAQVLGTVLTGMGNSSRSS